MDIENKEFVLFLKCAQEHHLRYLIIGGYAVNYFGFHRYTEDMDIWIGPTNENKICFLDTLKCMGYTNTELDVIKDEDFTTYFMCSLGSPPDVIDILTIIHKNISFDAAEREAIHHEIGNGIVANFIPYDFLKEVKLRSSRPKDLFDIARLEELRNKK
ncbi:MAG: hypothetical protein ICV53_17485 [Flavisolibacter sp.]|nr:hypothetical protein [Flavisolibacter sp.]MBD0367881.1 hypothetical protein [Flavisolibacter sp.]